MSSSRRSVRGIAVGLVLSLSLPSDAMLAQTVGRAATQELAATLVQNGPAVRVRPNRTLPRVSPPVMRTTFPLQPTTDDIVGARVFAGALVPVGREPTLEENAALARSLEQFLAGTAGVSRLDALRAAVDDSSGSPWRAAAIAQLAPLYAREGFFSRAAEMWNQAWELSRSGEDARSRIVADYAVGEWLQQAMNFGQVGRLEERLQEIEGRPFRGPAGQRIREAREGLAFLVNHHEDAIFSGPEALKMLLSALPGAQSQRALDTVEAYEPSHQGTTLTDLANLGAHAGVPLRMVHRLPVASLPVPSIVHLRSQHYSAVVGRRDGGYQLRDPILGGEFWMSDAAMADEASGYLLTPQGSASADGREVTADEGRNVVGHCAPGMPMYDEPCGCGDGPAGMPTYALHPLVASVVLRDTPLGYTPLRGPAIQFRLLYNHRNDPQPQVPEYGSMGPMWDFEWQSFVIDKPFYIFGEYHAATVQLRGESREAYGAIPGTHWRSRATLTKVADDPPRFERKLPDGTLEVFTLPDRPASALGRRTFLTEVIDPQGQTLTFTYDASFRLVALSDALGQVTTLEYLDPAWPMWITKVTDPFGRFATFTYDALGRLEAVTDVAGMTSRFTYAQDDFITSMTTPYGTTAFRHEPNQWGPRFVEAVDPAGGTERVEFFFSTTMIPDALPASEVPQGFAAWNTYMDHYNSFYWDKRTMALHPGDYSKAAVTNWLLTSDVPGGHGWSRTIPHSIKRPLESRVWYDYPNRTSAHVVGAGTSPTKVARVLDDGSTQVTQMAYNAQGMVTSKTDPLGRQTTYAYAANGIDVVEVRQTKPGGTDLLATYGSYNAQHLPGTVTDAAGQSTTTTYNAGGQPLTVTNAKSETITYAYDPGGDGELQNVSGPVTGVTTNYAYDSFGRVRTVTEADGYSVTTDYDALDRVIKRTYPDGTYEQFTYERLDPVRERDRLGRITRHFYDAVGRRIATRDPLGRVIRQDWCACGSLDALVDANGNRTSWERDLRGRVTREVRADGVTDTLYTYDGIGRLKTTQDPTNQVTTYTYLADDSLSSTVYTDAQVATPSVSYTYDPVYARVTTMVDGIGTTIYAYKAPGQMGAGQVASVDGPLSDDTITYTYDELGRAIMRAINGVGVTWAFDSLGRVTSEVNVLGMFGYTYDGVTSRLATVVYPNGQTSTYSYLPTNQDHRLQTIHHRYPGGATLSKFDYTYDAVGNIRTWHQQADSNPAVLSRYGYDAADQLTAAVTESTDPAPVVLKRYAYGYDPAGNRTFEQIDDAITLATHDKLNRLLQHIPGGPLTIAGTVNETATVTIQGKTVSVDASGDFRGTVPTTAGTNTFTIVATDASGNQTTRQFEADVAGQARTFTYDMNGNMTGDGERILEWDARNRLVRATKGAVTEVYTYNGKDQRARVINYQNGVVESDIRLVGCGASSPQCDERDVSGVTFRREFRHGEQRASASRMIVADHLGSVRTVTDGSLVAEQLDYDPWGRPNPSIATESSRGFARLRWSNAAGWMADYRILQSEFGRWTSEDPLKADEGASLYMYVSNGPQSFVDPRGLVKLVNNINWHFSPMDIDGPCASVSAGGCWVNQTWTPSCECDGNEECPSEFRAKAEAAVGGHIYVYSGRYPYKGRIPKSDKSVKDRNTAAYHEMTHVNAATAAGLGPLAAVEAQRFGSKSECQGACNRARVQSIQRFWDALRRTTWF